MERPRPTSGFEWSFRDVLMALTVSFMALAVLVLSASTAAKQHQPPGRLVVTLGWQHDRDSDVDLGVGAPGDAPVNYERRTGRVFDLLHDDRGRTVECAGQPATCDDSRIEVAVARFLPPGLWTVNAVLFQTYDGKLPVAVWVTVERLDPATHSTTRLFRRDGVLTHPKQELTLANFRIDEQGNLVPGSVNDAPRAMWRVVE